MKNVIIVSMTLVVTLLIFCGKKQQKSNQDRKKRNVPSDVVISVKTLVVKRIPFKYFVQCSGKIKPKIQQTLVSASSGIVIKSNATNGKFVNIGQPIIKCDTRSMLMKIARLKESLYNSKMNFESDLLSQSNILKHKSIGVRDSVVRKLRAGSGLSGLEIELEELEHDLANSTLVAPFSGQLVNVKVNNAGFIRSGEEVCTILTPNDLIMEAKVLETDIHYLKIGQVAIIVPVSGSKKYKAVLNEINPLVDEAGLLSLKLQIIDANGLISGMSAVASIIVPSSKCIAVPKSAIVNHNGKPVVFTSKNGLANWNYVEVGRDNGKEIEILKGIVEDDVVIISDNLQLSHGTPILQRND